ncbi:iron-containing alcohol dehydrogenase [Eisenbergiella sp.]
MIDFQFRTTQNIYFGKEAVGKLPELLNGCTDKVMLVYGGKSAKQNGAYDAITHALRMGGIAWVDFGGNVTPSYQKALEAVELCIKEKVGCVIGIGGSACIDMAKVIAFGAKHAEQDLWHCFYHVIYYDRNEPHLMVGAVPTYPSGGSEADTSAEIDNEATGQHGSLSGIGPDFAILNPEFTYTLDARETAYAAMTTFTQVSAAMLGGRFSISDKFAKGLLEVILESAKAAIQNPQDYDARAGQMWASALCTMGILSCGKDGWGYSIYSEIEVIRQTMPVSYRQAITVLFPRWLKTHAAEHMEDVRSYMTAVMGVDEKLPAEDAVEEGVRRIIELFEGFGLPMTYDSMGEVPTREQLEAGCDKTDETFCISRERILNMYAECFQETIK